MLEVGLRDRYRGCLLGLAVGDALGGPVEFMDRDVIACRHGRVREMIGGGWLDLEPGEYTDDTQMALTIARSIVEVGGVDPAHIAQHFVAWYRSMPKDVGKTTARSIRHLLEGVPWDEAGARTGHNMYGRDAGNGSLMRTAPIALIDRSDPTALVRDSIDVSRITHANTLATWSCVALDQAIVSLLTEPTADVVPAAARVEEPQVRDAVLTVPALSQDELECRGFVLDTLQAALWALLQHDEFEEVVVEAVSLGGDADTTGAVSGALAGARDGERAIPERWLAVLQNREKIAELADHLYDLSLRP